MKKMFPGGWNSQIGTNNAEYYLDPVQSALEKKGMIPGGWISQRKAQKEMISEPAITNKILALLKAPPSSPNHTGI